MYVPKDSPIPQNGMLPPPAGCVDASNAAVELARCISVNGRRIAYATVPSMASLSSISPGVAASAAVMLPASELARASILQAAAPVPKQLDTGGAGRVPPIVVPLSFLPYDQSAGAACGIDLPAPESVSNLVQYPVMPGRVPTVQRFFGGPRLAENRGGVSGYAPAWGDASAVGPADLDKVGGAPAGILGWVREHPWLCFGVLLAGVVAIDAGYRNPREGYR